VHISHVCACGEAVLPQSVASYLRSLTLSGEPGDVVLASEPISLVCLERFG